MSHSDFFPKKKNVFGKNSFLHVFGKGSVELTHMVNAPARGAANNARSR